MIEKIINKTLYSVSIPIIKAYTGTMLNMDVERKSPFAAGAKIIAPNHPSFSDPFIIASIIGHQSYILITDVIFHVPVIGPFLRRLDHIPVAAGQGQAAVDKALEHLQQGHTVVIFPEGANSPKQGGYNKEHTGVARLALASGAPVYPVGIYLDKDRLQTKKTIVDGQEKFTHRYTHGPYAITIGEAMHFSGELEDREYVKDVAHQVMLKIMNLAAESQQRWNHNNPPVPGAVELP